MSTVVRSLAAKVEVQTREAEANLDRFARKLRASGQTRFEIGTPSVSGLSSAGFVARQAAAAQSIAERDLAASVGMANWRASRERAAGIQEMFGAQQARMASVGAIGSRMFGGSGIGISSADVDGLTLRGSSGSGSAMQNLSGGALGELGAAGAVGQAGGLLGKVKGFGRFASMLRGAGPIAAAVIGIRHALNTTTEVVDNFGASFSDGDGILKKSALTFGDIAGRLTLMKGPMDAVAQTIVSFSDYSAAATAKTEALTVALSAQADEQARLRKERNDGSAMMAEAFSLNLAFAEAESLAERAEQTQRFADMQKVASSAAERYDARVNELRMSLMAGAISQDAFNESMKAANETYDEQSGVLDSIREQQQAIRDEWEDRRRAERETAALSKQTAMEEEDRLRRERRMEGVALDASRIFVGRGAQGVGKQVVEDPQFKIANQLLRRIADNIGTARAA